MDTDNNKAGPPWLGSRPVLVSTACATVLPLEGSSSESQRVLAATDDSLRRLTLDSQPNRRVERCCKLRSAHACRPPTVRGCRQSGEVQHDHMPRSQAEAPVSQGHGAVAAMGGPSVAVSGDAGVWAYNLDAPAATAGRELLMSQHAFTAWRCERWEVPVGFSP